MTLLHLIEDQWMILALSIESAKAITYPIYKERSLLLAKEKSVKTRSRKVFGSSLVYIKLHAWFSICHCKCLFRLLKLLLLGIVT